jgi:hypothetical protein
MLTRIFLYTPHYAHHTNVSSRCMYSLQGWQGNKSRHYQKFSFAVVPNTETPIPLYDIEIQSLLLSDDKHLSYQLKCVYSLRRFSAMQTC